MTAGRKHEPFSNPVVFFQEVLTFFPHAIPFERRTALHYQTNRIATGMGINTKKRASSQFLKSGNCMGKICADGFVAHNEYNLKQNTRLTGELRQSQGSLAARKYFDGRGPPEFQVR